MRIVAERALLSGGLVGPTEVEVADGRVVGVRPATAAADFALLCPGFVDIQVNGIDDVDCASADGDDWTRIGGLLLDQGVTAWCPTLVTAPLDRYERPLARIAALMADQPVDQPVMLGAHLEGPFLGGAPGAHAVDLIGPPDLEWLAQLPEAVRLVTLAPEQPAAANAVALLAARGVTVSLGHSRGTFEEAVACADAGATLVTHLFNGMGALHHREPGLVGAALSDPRLAASMIADLVHVHPAVLRAAFAAKGRGRSVLVTDAVAWRSARVGRGTVTLGEDGAPRLADGTLAGTALTMDQAIRNVVGAGVPTAEALWAATTAPSDVVRAAGHGRIDVGARADLVALDAGLSIVAVWVGGTQARD